MANEDALSILVLDKTILVMTLLWPVKTSKALADHVVQILGDIVILLLYYPLIIDDVRC